MDEFVNATAEQEFTLMLHDRLVELEKRVADLEPKPLDPRIKIAERPRHPFVKLEFDAKVDHSTWLKSVVERLGRRFEMRVSGVACQGWSLRAEKYVVEAIFEAGAMDHREVGRACLETGSTFGEVRAVHVHEVTNVAWFMESIASTDDEAGHATYENGSVSTAAEQTGILHSAWYRLNGWLASVMEDADVEHLRAFDADSAATALYRATARPLER
jgi:hypothetical protein